MLQLIFNRRILLSAAVVAALVAVALWPKTITVDVAAVGRGPLVVSIDEEGETRVRHRFIVSAPVAGRVRRIELEPGDKVKRGDVLARLHPEAPPLLDARARAEARAAIDTARATVSRLRAEEQRVTAALAQTERELGRSRTLAQDGLATSQQVDKREADMRAAREAAQAATFAVEAAASDLRRAETRLSVGGSAGGPDRIITVTAPVDGVVLKRVRESEAVVPAGDALVELGDPGQLEIVSDLLSIDAVKVKVGARAIIEQWGGDTPLDAKVRRIEPAGFTKVSALGVEEQRVNVVLDFAKSAVAYPSLGDAYRVEVRIVVWEAPSVLKVPTSALFRVGNDWAVYAAVNGRGQRTPVKIGQRTGQEAEVLEGLSDGTMVVLHPGDQLADGTRIAVRPSGDNRR
jgi:HlyD family secretion protein